jgi:C1A family cysteine protease
MRNLKHFFVILILCVTKISAAEFDLTAVKQAIQGKGANWHAEENWVTRLSFEEQKQLCGALMEIPDDARFITLPPAENLPKKFDWRDNNGNWVTPPKDQGNCGSCWDFAVVGQVEAWWKIYNNEPDSMIDLSEQFILSCANAGNCAQGGDPGLALEFVRSVGIPFESCFPYQARDGIPCGSACDNWEKQAVKIPDWSYITLGYDHIENIKNAVLRHPVTSYFVAYQDLSSYSGGVYEHVWGDTLGGHLVLIVGWNDDEQSWICKNSWGTDWGDKGYFRIKWGECTFGDYVLHIWDTLNEDMTLVANPKQLDISLTAGESVEESVQLINWGQAPMEYFTQDYNIFYKNCFQPDTFNALDGLSWWCHDESMGGYTDWWLQQLDLPAIDLSAAEHPKLNFMGYWAVEEPAGVPAYLAGIDGWDGCNVMLSTDDGESFNIINPTYPEYDCRNMYSYALMSTDWYEGKKIGGWGGKSGGWIPVEFDLSSFKTEEAIISFTFAADGGYSTPMDSELTGFFIDDIKVSDGENILFQNSGELDDSMRGHGYAGLSDPKVDWLEISESAGIIPYGAFIDFPFSIHTAHLLPGSYSGLIFFMANTTDIKFDPFVEKLTINLNVLAAEHDIAVQSRIPQEYPLFVPIPLNCIIKNIGRQDEDNFRITARIQNSGGTVYEENAAIPQLLIGESKEIELSPFCPAKIEDYELTIQTEDLSDDNNPQNNIVQSSIRATNAIDDFEKDTNLWDCQGGWGRPNEYVGNNSTFCMHVNKGLVYLNNMDATMTLKYGLYLQNTSKAVIKYWVRSNTVSGDVCYVELSSDNTNWVRTDSISGSIKWGQREVDLTPIINQGHNKIGFRYHFISDASLTRAGIYIDDIEIFADFATDVESALLTALPTEFALHQNYPNPFNPSTTIEYTLPQQARVHLAVYNLRGQSVKTLVTEEQSVGVYTVPWRGEDDSGASVSSGVYFYRLLVEDAVSGELLHRQEYKMILMK